MNQAAHNVLVKHALIGTKQADGFLRMPLDNRGSMSYCAQGLLLLEYCELHHLPWNGELLSDALKYFEVNREVAIPCPVEGCELQLRESTMLAHLNNTENGTNIKHHGFDFLTIARKCESLVIKPTS